MAHCINGYIAKQEDFKKADIKFCSLPQGFAFALELSDDFSGDYARVETSYFGGFGSQGSSCVVNGKEVFSFYQDEWDRSDSDYSDPINESLKLLGVVRDKSDEFDVINLGKYRSNRDFGLKEQE